MRTYIITVELEVKATNEQEAETAGIEYIKELLEDESLSLEVNEA